MMILKLDLENFQKWARLLYRCCQKDDSYRLYRLNPEKLEEDFKQLFSIKSIDQFSLNDDGYLLFPHDEKMRKVAEVFEKQEGFRRESMRVDEQLKNLMVCLHGDELFSNALDLRKNNKLVLFESTELSNGIANAVSDLKILKKISSFDKFQLFFSPEQKTSKIFRSPETGQVVLSRTAFFVLDLDRKILESSNELSSLSGFYKDYLSFVDSTDKFEDISAYVANKVRSRGYTDLKSFLPFLVDLSKYSIESNCLDVFTNLPKIMGYE